MKKITKDFALELVEAMFFGWSFDFEIELIGDDCFNFQIGENNNEIEVHTQLEEDEKTLGVYVYLRSENLERVGNYDLNEQEFERDFCFFEVMFSEHLID